MKEIRTKEEFISFYQDLIHRPGSDKLLAWLMSGNSDFFTAPASSRFHSSMEGGLCSHSVNVFARLLQMVSAESKFAETEEGAESVAVCGLLHDLCKVNFYKLDTRNVKKNGAWEAVPYYSVSEKFVYGHGEKSVFLIQQFMPLKPNEAQAIRYHMGDFSDQDTSRCYSQNPLAVMLHAADLTASYLDEPQGGDER